MFSLFSGLIQWFFQKVQVRILIIGLDKAGKSTFLEQLKRKYSNQLNIIPFNKIRPTVGLNIGRMNIKGVNLTLWDLGGEKNLRSIWSKYYSEAQGIIFIIDSKRSDRFDEVLSTFELFRTSPDFADVPILVCANKQDLSDACTLEEISKYLHISYKNEKEHSANKLHTQNDTSHTENKNINCPSGIYVQRKIILYPISALISTGIDDAINWLIDAVMNSPKILQVMHKN